MPDDPANYNMTGISRATGNRFVGGCGVRATAGNVPCGMGAGVRGSLIVHGAA